MKYPYIITQNSIVEFRQNLNNCVDIMTYIWHKTYNRGTFGTLLPSSITLKHASILCRKFETKISCEPLYATLTYVKIFKHAEIQYCIFETKVIIEPLSCIRVHTQAKFELISKIPRNFCMDYPYNLTKFTSRKSSKSLKLNTRQYYMVYFSEKPQRNLVTFMKLWQRQNL